MMLDVNKRKKKFSLKRWWQDKVSAGPVRLAWLVFLVTVIGVVVMVLAQIFDSVVVGGGRYNLVVVGEEGAVGFVSVDSVEGKIESFVLPEDLYIRSRSVGEYRVGQLYVLGSFEDEAGEFVRRKVQGFLRVPVTGWLVVERHGEAMRSTMRGGLWRSLIEKKSSNIGLVDSLKLMKKIDSYVWYEQGSEDLIKEGILVSRIGEGYSYNEDRLREYMEGKFFDWIVAGEQVSVAVVNVSGEERMGADLADFLGNMGMDVVVVKSSSEVTEETRIVIGEEELKSSYVVRALKRLLGLDRIERGETEEYRAEMVIFAGRDMKTIF